MAYAALLSLARTTGEIILDQDRYSIPCNKKQQIRSIYEPFIFLQEFLEDFPEKANILDGQIRDLAYEAEHIIESFILMEARSHWWNVLAVKSKLKWQIRRIRKETNSITREVMIIKNNSADTVQLGASSSAAAGSPSRSAPIIKIGYMVGLHEDLLTIKSRLCGESPNLEVIPIVGMGGIGKTTLAKCVYDDPLTVQRFDIRVWVTVSQDYNADVVLSALLASMEEFDKDRSEESKDRSKEEKELPGAKVHKILKGRRYLLVMDDIWSTDAWDDVRLILPDDGNGSRIILTTRETDMAAYACRLSCPHKMRFMDETQSWNLLQQKVFAHLDCPPELENIGKEIARRCKGLPLAIAVVAGLLSTISNNPASWREIAQNVNSVTKGGQFENILSLSYTHLPHYLRPCFLYMGMFPEDCEVRVSKLIKLWVAEGFLRRLNRSKTLEEEAEVFLEGLVKRNLVLVTKRKCDGRIKSCSLHDLMRDLCIRKANEEKFLVNFSSGLPVKGRKNQRRVSVTRSGLPYFQKIYGLTMHTILCFLGISVANKLEGFRLLRVLDAGNVYVHSLPDQLFDLFYLAYLGICYLGRIPTAISKLHNLETLSLRAKNDWMNFITLNSFCLPLEIWRMPRLRHLVFYGRLPNPEGITSSSLENLQTLSIASHAMCSERILRMIPNLKKLEMYCSNYRPGENLLNNLVNLRQLEDLKLRSSFRIVFYQKDDFTFPKTLRKLTLSRVTLPWEEMTIVGSLPNLRVLKLTHWACKGSTWETSDGEFPKLEILVIEKSYLQDWITESSHFPMLKSLVLDECSKLAEIPEDIGEIPTLELIEVKGEARTSLVESAQRILEKQQEWGNDALQVRCMAHR
ncbi:putative late blight resistance protein homolog R1B-16 [Salvia miltiorrhiza]|uniref:putative late blight resistance protein homolog R1B-16 n=1 Tax=Salvia miltiorrhiza TaxID=226208 RepID=UPI0025AC8BC8|nr:putative late blight resistance protein homolog R1B-16 [Salvia miltiorrhiza]XP_057801575.1 putative late blight resistance protein homolog R1B-16 [Salvia miltiorrhiza]XP_057801576.1 putative late blight resistance protein homolog R1B-16 [Salvia miltiorrhiza]XP_057801578.1 putative late blight resistance protein homolog R1B-16 [Salvia miltiorrhiza]